MATIVSCELPGHALLDKYRNRSQSTSAGAYTDCFSVQVDGVITLSEFVYAFYTTIVFKLERVILQYLAGRPSTDRDARHLADAATNSFAAWSVEDRAEDQLLMCDFRRRTRSWFMVEPVVSASGVGTRLYFGSAVVPVENKSTGRREIGKAFSLLLGFHKLYSIVLLRAAARRLRKNARQK